MFNLIVNHLPEQTTPIANQAVTIGGIYSYTIAPGMFIDLDGETLFFSAEQTSGADLPNWLGFDSAQRRFSGAPQAADLGEINIRVTVQDLYTTLTDEFKLLITEPINIPTIKTGDTIEYTLPDGYLQVFGPIAGSGESNIESIGNGG